jgi:hypothetical protein
MRFATRTTLAVIAGVALALALIAWAYWPGLGGPFLFDDYANLDILGAHGRIDSWPAFLYYITSGAADPTGRPIALLTFLLDATTWPAAPWPFKRTNLLLHLLNTGLLALTVARLQARLRDAIPLSPWTPMLAAVLWGAHPFFVSTTLYIIQREAMLPMTFVMLALLAWDRAVHSFGNERRLAGWAWAILGMGGATALAGLSKANGFLAPLLVGIAYLWILRPQSNPVRARLRTQDHAAALCLALPSAALLFYLFQAGWHSWSFPQLEGRDWTLPERLLSEPRAIWRYVARLALPRAGGGGLYVDDFAISHGWLNPATTLPAVLALSASAIAAIVLRRRFPIASFAWLFFLAAHLLEGSTIALELYFEHRNYLPAAFLGWPLAHALLRPGAYLKARVTLAVVVVCGLLLLTHQRALVWGNEALLSALSAEHEVDSPRAQVIAAGNEIDRGDMVAGLSRIHAMQRRHAGSVDVAINAVSLECASTGALMPDTLARARQTLATANTWNYGLYQWMQDAIHDASLRHCRGFGLPGLAKLVASAESNPQSAPPQRKRDFWHVRGRLALAEDQPDLALLWFNGALSLKPDVEYALVQAAALGDAGARALGIQHLDFYARIEQGNQGQAIRNMGTLHAWLLRHNGYYGNELSSLRQRLVADEKNTPESAPQPQ